MSKKLTLTLMAIAILMGAYSTAFGFRSLATSFQSTYPASPLSALSTVSGQAGNLCTVCHGASGPPLNSYGTAYLNNGNYASIESLDSDGDTFSNIIEINAGTFPGNASSKPAIADTTKPVVTAFAIPATSTSLTVAITTLTATDNIGVTGYMVTESSTAPLAGDGGWSASKPASFTFASEGAKTLYAWAKDAAGNVSLSMSAGVTITLPVADTTKPVVTAFAIPATSTSLTVAITTLTATDNIGVTGYMVTESSTAPLAGDGGWSASKPASFTFASEGAKTLYAWAKDAAGNVSLSLSAGVTITLPPDTTKPVVTAFAIPATSSSLTVAITTLTATDNIGVTGYMVTESSTAPLAGDGGWSASKPASFTFASEGAKTLYAWAKDAAGNVSLSMSDNVTITLPDTIKPVVTAFAIPATSTSLTVAITTLTATDNIGVTGYMVTESSTAPLSGAGGWTVSQPASYIFASEGAKTLYAWAKDAAGNVSLSMNAGVTITLPYVDTIQPVVTAFAIPATSTSLTVAITTLTADDNIGVTGYALTETNSEPTSGWTASAPTSYTFSSGGKNTLYAWAIDAAGNVSKSNNAKVNITAAGPPVSDSKAPKVKQFSLPKDSTSLTVPIILLIAEDDIGVTGYALTETKSEPTSGWTASAPTSYTFSSEGKNTLYAWAMDAEGNISKARKAKTKISLPEPEDVEEDDAISLDQSNEIVLLPAPDSQQIFTYDPVESPLRNSDLSVARPVGIAEAGDFISLMVNIGRFAEPVDAYITLYSPSETSTEPVTIFTLGENNEFVFLPDLKEPWRSNVTDLNEQAIDMHISTLLSGKYMLVLEVTPVGRQDVYYHWITYFIVQ